MSTADDLRARAAELVRAAEKRAHALEAEAAAVRKRAADEARDLRKAAGVWEASAVHVRGRSGTLTSIGGEVKPAKVEVNTNGAKRRGPRQVADDMKVRIGSKNADFLDVPFGKWLHDQGKTVVMWCDEHVSPETKKPRWSASAVRGWMNRERKPGKRPTGRPIPGEAADLIASETADAVPATVASWPNGISRFEGP